MLRDTAFDDVLTEDVYEAGKAFFDSHARTAREICDREGKPEAYEKSLGSAYEAALGWVSENPRAVGGIYAAAQLAGATLVASAVDLLKKHTPKPTTMALFDFFTKPQMAYVADSMLRRTGDSRQLQTTMRKLWHDATFYHCGKKVYEPTPGLAEKLLHTEIRGLSTADIKLPFPSFYIRIPKRAGFTVWNEESGIHTATGVYVGWDPGVAVAPEWTHLPADVVTWPSVRLMVWGPSKNDDPFDDALEHFAVYLKPGVSLDEALKISVDLNVIDRSESDTQKLLRWILNVLMYATWPEAEVEDVIMNAEARALWERHGRAPKGKKREDILKRFRGVKNKDRRIVLGRSVTVLAARDAIEAREGRPLTVRTLVTGHWQRYAIGKGRAERVWRWREPFWRGPEGGEPGSTTHKLV